MPFLWDLGPIFFNSILVLTPSGQFLDCAATAFSDRYDVTGQGLGNGWHFPSTSPFRHIACILLTRWTCNVHCLEVAAFDNCNGEAASSGQITQGQH